MRPGSSGNGIWATVHPRDRWTKGSSTASGIDAVASLRSLIIGPTHYFDDTYLEGDRWKKFDGYCTDVWFDEAMNFMTSVAHDAGGSKPFFVYLATNAPHGPYLVDQKWKQPFLDMGLSNTQASFKGMVTILTGTSGDCWRFLRTKAWQKTRS